MAGFALLLPSLGVAASAGAAVVAVLFNLLVLPRLAGDSLSRPGDLGRRVPIGIAAYPVTVLALILLFAPRLELAAAGWGYLALGDGLASVVGQATPGPRLPWNRSKSLAGSLAFVLFGTAGAAFLYGWCAPGPAGARMPSSFEFAALAVGALAAAIVESLPSELDDNVLPPIVGAAVLSGALAALPGLGSLATEEFLKQFLVALVFNANVALLAEISHVVRRSGAFAGLVFGTVVLALGGWPAYILLWIFFGAGTLLTRMGRRRKEALGKAEEAGGQRGAANVLANVTVPAFCVAVAGLAHGPTESAAWLLAATAAFATALADTTGTEVGQALRTPTFLLPDFRRVPPGTDGAVSVGGTLAAIVAAAAVGLAAAGLGLFDAVTFAPGPHGASATSATFATSAAVAAFPSAATALCIVIVVLAAFAGSTAESLLQREGASWKVTNGHVLNFVNTFVGAGLAALLARVAAVLRLL